MDKKYFFGNEISHYGLEHGYVDYGTLAKSFDCVLNNEIIKFDIDNWDIVSGYGFDYDEDEENNFEIYQYYIVSDSGASILQNYTDEILFYNENLDMYVWGVTHWGTAWDYVLTDIKIDW